MPEQDRLAKMREIAAKAREAKASREEAERGAQGEEGKKVERAQVEQELAGATGELEQLSEQIAEAEALTEQMADVSAEARAEFDAELTALRQEAEAARARLADLTARKGTLDAKLSATAVAETPPAAAPEKSPAPAEVIEKTPEEIGKEFETLATAMMKEVQAISNTPYEKLENVQQRLDQLKGQRAEVIAKINELMGATLQTKGPDAAASIEGQLLRLHLISKVDATINTLAQKANGLEKPDPGRIELQTEYSEKETGEIIKWTRWREKMAKARGETDPNELAQIDAIAFADSFKEFSSANFSPEGVSQLKQRDKELGLDAFRRRQLTRLAGEGDPVGRALSLIDLSIQRADSRTQRRRE